MTAVEFIEEYLRFKGLIIDDKNVPQVLIGVINQAKELEKQQQDEQWDDGFDHGYHGRDHDDNDEFLDN